MAGFIEKADVQEFMNAWQLYENIYLTGDYRPKQVSLLSTMKFIGIRTKILRRGILNKFQIVTKGKVILSWTWHLKNLVLRRVITDFFSKSLHRRLLEKEIKRIKLTGLTLDIGSKNRRYDDYFPEVKIVAFDIEPQLRDGTIIQCDTRNICFKDNLFDGVHPC